MKRITLWPLTSLAKLHFERAMGYPMPDVIANLEVGDEVYGRIEYAAKEGGFTIHDVLNQMLEEEPLMVRAIARRVRRAECAATATSAVSATMKVKDRALMKLMLDALVESRECLEMANRLFALAEIEWAERDRILKSLDRSNRVIHRALIQLRECDLA